MEFPTTFFLQTTMTIRRNLIGAVATAAAASSLAACAGQGGMTASGSSTTPKTFVLVHGAWHGGWCWTRVRDRLNSRGHQVFTPTLTGLGDRMHLLTPDTDLQMHVTDVANLIKFESLESVVLVGHSYAGVVISQVVEKVPEIVSSIIYLDAFMPGNGRSLLDDAMPATREATLASVRASGASNTVSPIPAAAFKVNEADQAMVNAKCTPQPFKTFSDKLQLTGARERVAKKSYIRAGLYPSLTFDACFKAKMDDNSWRTARVDNAGHDVMLDAPDELTRLILQFA